MMHGFIIETGDFQLTQSDFLIRMLVAVGVGLVIGLEREFSSSKKGEIFAGLRTFSIVALCGFVCAFFSLVFFSWVFIAGLFAVILIVAIWYWISAKQGDVGSTTEFALIFTYLLGGLIVLGYIEYSLALTVILMVLLSLKPKFKSIIGQLTQDEIYAFIRFIIIALLILPFLPNTYYGPFNVLNPREIGWVIVLTSGIGFVGYLLMKFLGSNRGLILTGIVGGLVSSTVISWIFSKKSKETPTLSNGYALAIFAAATVMILRVLFWVFLFNKDILKGLFIPLLIIFIAALSVTLFFYKKQQTKQRSSEELPLGDPLNIRDAVFFGLLYSGILLLVSYASDTYGEKGIYVTSAISALTDIDAISISVSKLAGESIQFLTAQNAILIATLTNTLIKIGITLWFGCKALKKKVLFGYGIIFVAGIVGFIILNI